ncbi:hypothetical protein ABUW04_06910 [Streptacidiphilus sp. N1-10]|uniref:Uncharacterized protein n=1 Tax=Streptacidiphilus jeojiensis TaxID=3229225 RepID=A0ABV6XIB7_9ACTN
MSDTRPMPSPADRDDLVRYALADCAHVLLTDRDTHWELDELLATGIAMTWIRQHQTDPSEDLAQWLTAEAAYRLITACGIVLQGTIDPAIPELLTALSRHGNGELALRLDLAAAPPTTRARATVLFPAQRPAAGHRPVSRARGANGPCNCACASGGWCGGCGHRGCTARHH